MEKLWKEHKAWIALGMIVVLILIPLGVAWMLSFSFIITDTSNEWIGFWGGYLGAFIGGIITLYVMHETNKSGRQDVEKTLNENKRVEMRKETVEFCNLLIKKNALLIENIEDTICKTSPYVASKGKLEYLLAYSKQLRYTKAIALEIIMHLRARTNQPNLLPNDLEEVLIGVEKLHTALEEYDSYMLTKMDEDDYNTRNAPLVDQANETCEAIEEYIRALFDNE